MAKRIFQAASYTPVGTADNAALPNGYQAIKGGSATQLNRILEIMCGGQAGAASVNAMIFSRSVTIGVTPTALASPNSDGPSHPSTAALAAPPITYVAAATGPLRSNLTTDPKLNLTFNSFGGILRWMAAFDEEYFIIGNTAALFGEVTLSALNIGTPGLMGSHVVYEPL